MTTLAAFREIEPLVRASDLDEYRAGLARRLSGAVEEEAFTGFRTLYGVYGQKQPGVQMVRIKIPGGVVQSSWLRTLARFNREFCQGDAHITTRQDIQTYFVPLERTAEALEFLYSRGMTTREACGNTLRNVTACSLAGRCPREHVDAGAVADRVARSWLRQPLTQHMPRKVKISVSGCGVDCGGSGMHDLAFVATSQNGQGGFRITAGGGLGGQPRPAVTVLDFATEAEIPQVVEALVRLHHRYSDRVNRNASRVKFLVKRFGEDKFRTLFREEFDRLRGLVQRPQQPLTWRTPDETAIIPRTPVGVVPQHDGRTSIVANPPLGLLSSDQLDALADLVADLGLNDIRLTREQNLILADLKAEQVAGAVQRLKAINIDVPDSAAVLTDVVSCPGTTTCRIGITNSQTFGKTVWEATRNDPNAAGLSVRISGCQNSCGLHHVGEFGFHGMAKKINGESAPHYQLHFGGDYHAGGDIGLSGPIIPTRHALEALRLLQAAYAPARADGQSVRSWAAAQGKAGIAAILAPLSQLDGGDLFTDWGEEETFKGAPTVKGECALPLAPDGVLATLADDALIRFDRLLANGRWDEALRSAGDAISLSARRLLQQAGAPTTDDEEGGIVLARLQTLPLPRELAALDEAEALRVAALSSGKADDYREAVALFVDLTRARLAPPKAAA